MPGAEVTLPDYRVCPKAMEGDASGLLIHLVLVTYLFILSLTVCFWHMYSPTYTAISTTLHSKVGPDKNVYSIYFFSLYKGIRDNFQYFYQLNSTIPEEHRPGWQPHRAWPFLLALLPNHLSFSYFLRFLTLSYTSFLT